jgi:sugar phosphate permease
MQWPRNFYSREGGDVRLGGGRRRIFAVTWITYAGFYFCRKNLSIVLPVLHGANGLGRLDLANIIFGYSLLYAVGQFACGPLSDRYGPRRIVGAGLVVIVISNLMMCLHSSPLWLLSFACLNGVGQSTGWSGLVKMMGSWFTGGRRGVVMAWWGTNYVLGGFLATAFATWTVTQRVIAPELGWRRGFLFPAFVLFAVTVIFFLLARDTPQWERADASRQLEDLEYPVSKSNSVVRSWKDGDLMRLLKSQALWSIGISYFFLELCRYALLFWLPFFLVNRLHFGLQASGYISSLYELAGVTGALLAGYVSDRFMQSRRAPISAAMLCGFGLVALLPLFNPVPGLAGVAIAIATAGMLTYGPDTLLSGAAAQDVGQGVSTATSSGLIDGIGHLGSLVSPYLVIYVSADHNWNLLFGALSCGGFLAAASLIPIWNLRPADRQSCLEMARE